MNNLNFGSKFNNNTELFQAIKGNLLCVCDFSKHVDYSKVALFTSKKNTNIFLR